MLRSSGALAILVASLLICCSAERHQDSELNEGFHTGERYDGSGQNLRNLESRGSNRHREAREIHGYGLLPYLMAKQRNFESGFYSPSNGGKRDQWPAHMFGYFSGEGLKRHFDEIDLSGLNNFLKERNMDEIDQTLMPFPYAKRGYHPFVSYLDMSNFDKKKYRPDYPMDEIDLSQFPIGSKRSANTL